jgi:hypothetical protein
MPSKFTPIRDIADNACIEMRAKQLERDKKLKDSLQI